MKFTVSSREKIIATICKRITKYIHENKLTQNQSTDLGACSQTTIIRIKKLDRIDRFRFETVMDIASRFGVVFDIHIDSLAGSYLATNSIDLRDTLLLSVSRQIGLMDKLGISVKSFGISNTRIYAMRNCKADNDLGVDLLMKAFTLFGGTISIELP